MQTPKRKPGEYAQIPQDYHMTKPQIEKLESELEYLKSKKRPRASQEVSELAALGDFSENHAYQMAKGRLRGINNRITQIEHTLTNAIEIPESSGDVVEIGSTVTVSVSGTETTFTILGSAETDPGSGKISHLSPVGSALIGHTVGDSVAVEIGERTIMYTIRSIS